MQIKLLDDTDSTELATIVQFHINERTRFVCYTDILFRVRSGDIVRVRDIRLKDKKKWCGSHPFACDIGGPRSSNLLEGADWVEFNDSLNDILDQLGVSANVESIVCILRKDTRRRVHYDGHWQTHAENGIAFVEPQPEWNKDEDDCHYIEYVGHEAPASWYPEGTPGLYLRGVGACG